MILYGPIKKSDGCNPLRYLTAPGVCGTMCLWSIADLAPDSPAAKPTGEYHEICYQTRRISP